MSHTAHFAGQSPDRLWPGRQDNPVQAGILSRNKYTAGKTGVYGSLLFQRVILHEVAAARAKVKSPGWPTRCQEASRTPAHRVNPGTGSLKHAYCRAGIPPFPGAGHADSGRFRASRLILFRFPVNLVAGPPCMGAPPGRQLCRLSPLPRTRNTGVLCRIPGETGNYPPHEAAGNPRYPIARGTSRSVPPWPIARVQRTDDDNPGNDN